MKKLYIAIFNEWEVYSAHLECCSTDKNLIEKICKEWYDIEKSYGNAIDYIINEIDIDDCLAEILEKSINQYYFTPKLYFNTEVQCKEYNPDWGSDYVSVRILKVLNVSTKKLFHSDRADYTVLTKQAVFSCEFILRDDHE